MITVEQVRAFTKDLPRSYEVLVHDRVKFRVGQIVFVAFISHGLPLWTIVPDRSAIGSGPPQSYNPGRASPSGLGCSAFARRY